MRRRERTLAPLLLMMSLFLVSAFGALAQELEIEPNDPCSSPQDLGPAPLTLDGTLGSPDIDFFRVRNASGTVIIDLEGTGLADPLLGVFSSDCFLLALDDDSGEGLNSRLTFTVPPDGTYIIAATSYSDFGFVGLGSSSGTYRLRAEEIPRVQEIRGRAVDADTGEPVDFVSVTLFRCFDGFCFFFAGHTYTASDGTFRFDGPFLGLNEGEYRVVLSDFRYELTEVGPFFAAARQAVDLGDIALPRSPAVGSIRGRLTDAATGQPLPGNSDPFAWVELQLCDQFSPFCWTIRSMPAGPDGSFHFAGGPGSFLPPGTYQIRVFADQYEAFTSAPFFVGDDVDYDTGELRIKSFPVRIHLVEPCPPIPARGGNCRFTVRITNGMPGHLTGETWSVVQASFLGSPVHFTSFQTGISKAISLQPGGSATVPFTFFVPGEVSDGAYICAAGFAAGRPHAFNTLGQHHLFCLVKGGGVFSVVPEREKREAVRRSQGEGPKR
jgi:hypothetical protein